MIKNNWSLLLLMFSLFAVSFSIVNKNKEDNIHLSVKTFAVGNGWGYDVLANDSVYIHQQFIPAVEGNKVFSSKEQANTVGMIVINKLKHQQSPTITLQELDSCQVVY